MTMAVRKVLSESEIDRFLGRMDSQGICDLRNYDLSKDESILFLCDAINAKKAFFIKHLDISTAKISMGGLELLVASITPMGSLESFTARSCLLTKEAGTHISKLLAATGCLKTLDLRDNMLGDGGVTALFAPFMDVFTAASHGLATFSLQAVDLGQNVITDAGILSICRSLMQFIRRSHAIGVSNRLSKLVFSSNRLGEKAAYCLAQLLNSKPYSSSHSPDKSNYYPCNIRELHMDHNAIGSTGMAALLGDAKAHSFSPLRVLNMAHCGASFKVFEHLAGLIVSGSVQIERLDLSFSEAQAKELIYLSAKHYDSIYGSDIDHKTNVVSLHLSIKKLVDALLCISHKQKVLVHQISLGQLPRNIYALCIQGSYEHNHGLFEDCLKALEYLNPAADVLDIPYISNIEAWLQGERYDNPLFTISADRVRDRDRDREVHKPAPAVKGMQPLAEVEVSPIKDSGSRLGRSLLDISTSSPTVTVPAQSQQKDKPLPRPAKGSRLFEEEASPSKPIASAHTPSKGIAEGSDEEHDVSVIQLKEQEYLRRRQDHSSALHTLSNEIQDLIRITPDKTATGAQSPTSRGKHNDDSRYLLPALSSSMDHEEDYSQYFSSEVKEALKMLAAQKKAATHIQAQQQQQQVQMQDEQVSPERLQAAIQQAVAQVMQTIGSPPVSPNGRSRGQQQQVFFADPPAPPPPPAASVSLSAPTPVPVPMSSDLVTLQSSLMAFMAKVSGDVQSLVSAQMHYERSTAHALQGLADRISALEQRPSPRKQQQVSYKKEAETLLLGELANRLDLVEKFMILEKKQLQQQQAQQQHMQFSPDKGMGNSTNSSPMQYGGSHYPSSSTMGSTNSYNNGHSQPEDRRSARRRLLDQMLADDQQTPLHHLDNDTDSVQSLSSLPRYRRQGQSPAFSAHYDTTSEVGDYGSVSTAAEVRQNGSSNRRRSTVRPEDPPPPLPFQSIAGTGGSRRGSARQMDPPPETLRSSATSIASTTSSSKGKPGFLGHTGTSMRRHSSYT